MFFTFYESREFMLVAATMRKAGLDVDREQGS